MNRTTLIILAAAVAVGLGISQFLKTSQSKPIVNVVLPASLSTMEEMGRTLFATNCAQCHGAMAGGTGNGPPLVHVIYEPNHHSDASFQQAARNGVRAHHWPFGNMPPVASVTPQDVTRIVAYVRALQRANGIH